MRRGRRSYGRRGGFVRRRTTRASSWWTAPYRISDVICKKPFVKGGVIPFLAVSACRVGLIRVVCGLRVWCWSCISISMRRLLL